MIKHQSTFAVVDNYLLFEEINKSIEKLNLNSNLQFTFLNYNPDLINIINSNGAENIVFDLNFINNIESYITLINTLIKNENLNLILLLENNQKSIIDEYITNKNVFFIIKNDFLVFNLIQIASLISFGNENKKNYELLSNQIQKINDEIKLFETNKTEIIEKICHELRTPLASIRGYTELMLKNKMGEITEKQSNALNIVLRNIDKMLLVIDELDELSRVHPLKNTCITRKIDISSIISEAINKNLIFAINKNVLVKINPISKTYFINGDFSQILYVFSNLFNLIINDCKNNSKLEIYLNDENSNINIKILLNCKSIFDDMVINNINNFFNTNDNKNNKLNVELSLICEIIKQHQGKISIEKCSNVTEEYLINISLPLYYDNEILYEYNKISTINLINNKDNKKIIIVDDDEDCAQLLNLILSTNYNVIITNSDNTLFKALEQHPDCSLILLDINMTNIDGITLCKMLKANEKFATIPVLMISASMQETKKQQSLEAGALGFLEKPFETEKVLEFINNIIK